MDFELLVGCANDKIRVIAGFENAEKKISVGFDCSQVDSRQSLPLQCACVGVCHTPGCRWNGEEKLRELR